MRRGLVGIAVVLAALSAITCGPGPTPKAVVATTSAPPASSPIASTSVAERWPAQPSLPPEDPNLPLLERVRARGPAHAPPVVVAAAKGEPERTMFFFGNSAALLGSFIVATGASQPIAVDMPRAVKVLGTLVRETRAYVWLETLAVLDQPAGMRAVLVIDLHDGTRAETRESPASLADLEKQLSTPPQNEKAKEKEPEKPKSKSKDKKKPGKGTKAAKGTKAPPAKKPSAPAVDPTDALKAADASTQALAKALPKAGLEIFHSWQGVFDQRVATVTASALASSPHLDAIRTAVHRAAEAGCINLWCGALTVGNEDGHTVIRRFAVDAPPRASMPPSTPKTIAASTTSTETETAVRMLVHEPVLRVFGEAPRGPKGGTVGVVQLDRESERILIVVTEPNFAAVLATFDGAMFEPGDVAFAVRFADLDGDGRTDVVLQVKGKAAEDQLRVAHLATSTIETIDAPDDATLLALWSTTELDAAVDAAVHVEPRGVTRAEGCKIVKQLTSPFGFTSASLPKAPLITYKEPRLPTWRSQRHTPTQVDWSTMQVPADCDLLECDPLRPICTYTDGPGKDFYWLAWDKGVLKLSGFAYYTGS